MRMKLIKPVDPTRHVVDTQTMQALPPEGIVTEMSLYWKRRENDGDVTIVDYAAPVQKPAEVKVVKPKTGIDQ